MYIPLMQPVFHALSLVYRLGCRIRNAGFDRGLFKITRAPLHVVSVGNLVFGGSGKTPLVMDLLRKFLERKLRPALVTRGYRGDWERTGGILSDGISILGDWREAGDEPYMVALNLPEAGVYVGKNRGESCRRASEAGFQVAVLDDGFQHRGLARDLDIVLFDPGERIGLREPVSSLRRADIVLWNPKSEYETGRWRRRFPDTRFYRYGVTALDVFPVKGRDALSPSSRRGTPFLAVCGIARPERFTPLLETMAIRPLELLRFPDHHDYPARSLERIRRRVASCGAEAVITTEKDAVKLADSLALRDIPLYYLKIALEIEPEFYQDVFSSLDFQPEP